MISSVKVTNQLAESVTIELRFPEKSGFLVQAIDGLGPAKATINTTKALSTDGSTYNSSRVESRNIVFKLSFLPNPTIETTRQQAYKYFPIKQEVMLEFTTENRVCYTLGYVESNEPDIFTNDSGTVISLVCPDPYLYGIDLTNTIFSGVQAQFGFPLSNESLVLPMIKLGDLENKNENTLFYSGDAATGVRIYMHAVGPARNVVIYNMDTHEFMRIMHTPLVTLLGSGISTGDDIVICTIKGKKSVFLQRTGVLYNILGALDRFTNWFQLTKGDNRFGYTTDQTYPDSNLQFRIENQTLYEGV